MSNYPKIGAINPNVGIVVTQCENGGFTISQHPEYHGAQSSIAGAYSNPKDMIDALSWAFLGDNSADAKQSKEGNAE